jgi:pyruvate/2-oxoglutarate dehydrogenase complex dihydrolipoamide acyltransferase (E2) component
LATKICIPLLSMSMSEGTIVEWLVPEGGEVKAGQSLYSIETEKTVVEVEAPESGKVHHLVEAGSTLPVGAEIAEIS